MAVFNNFEACANCPKCGRLQRILKGGQFVGWGCKSTTFWGGEKIIPLPSIQPPAQVETMLGFINILTVMDSTGKPFACSFTPKPGFRLNYRVPKEMIK